LILGAGKADIERALSLDPSNAQLRQDLSLMVSNLTPAPPSQMDQLEAMQQMMAMQQMAQ